MAVHYAHSWIMKGAPTGVYAPCYVNVFGIHEEPLVEQSLRFQGLATEKKKRTQQIWRVYDYIMIGGCQQISVHTPPHKTPGEETFRHHIPRSGKTPGRELQVTVGIIYFRHHHADAGIRGHITRHIANDIALPPGVGIQHKMCVGTQHESVTDGFIVACSETTVHDMAIFNT